MARCRSCNEQIQWVRLQSGKNMPVDPGYVSIRTQGLMDTADIATIVTDDGRVIQGAVVTEEFEDERGRESHFATCPNAKQHRKK